MPISAIASGLAGIVFAVVPSIAGDAPKAQVAVTAKVHLISAEGIGEAIGTITVSNGAHGLKVTPDLKGLSPGLHALQFHGHGGCGPAEKDGKMVAGLKAGGHYGHGDHSGHGDAHGKPKGDLPELTVAADGSATTAIMSHYLSAGELAGRSIMIHAASEADGAGARIACGVFPKAQE